MAVDTVTLYDQWAKFPFILFFWKLRKLGAKMQTAFLYSSLIMCEKARGSRDRKTEREKK